nr:unnamed protein product [Callosobruchus analis]
MITQRFNSNPPNMVLRTKDSLRKCYDNMKKHIRREVADEKRYLSGTGGGPPKQNDNPDKDLTHFGGPRATGGPQSV